MTNVFSTLKRLGWQTTAVDLWVSPKGQTYHLASLDAPLHLVLHAIVDSYN